MPLQLAAHRRRSLTISAVSRVTRAREIVSELADGVAELHARGIVHGNITQTSAMLTTKGKARLSLTSAIGGDEHARRQRA